MFVLYLKRISDILKIASLWLEYFEDIQQNHSSCTFDPSLSHLSQERLKPWTVPLYHTTHAEESHDPRRLRKRTEHDRDSSIFVYMANCLAS